ncbi:DNA-binding response regulator [Paenibacillus sp. CAA11]|uniref:response regulator transcription factor n=1 Tax=Paenibacillus sp. CAA11 TaxID=1532905 RepID=UPI000D343589|nr:response regulator transcription factor [Paenibacillus sp. CAA11]AWB46056.1 DNA-binding response regulator [Paenibacillus sp. CAA11]
MQPYILTVEDDLEISQLIVDTLCEENYKVDAVYDGHTACEALQNQVYHLVILDIMLPDMDGWDVLQWIREHMNIPVLILTARDSELDTIHGLNLGADDYLTKPYHMGEFIARVNAQLRRYLKLNEQTPEDASVLIHGDLMLNCHTCEATVRNQTIPLTAKEFAILELLMRSPKRIYSKSQIFAAVWHDDYTSDDNTVMVHIRRLRSKIEEDPSHPVYIQTIWGIGYRMGKLDPEIASW